MMAAQVGKVGLEYLAAQKEASRKEAEYKANRQRAAQAQDLKIQVLNTRMLQEAESASQTKLDMQIATLENAEKRAVVAGESGLGGGSTVDNFIADPETKRLRAETSINQTLKSMEHQLELDKMGVTAETENRINSLPRGQKPNFLMYAAKAGASAYATYSSEQALLPENVAKQELAIQQAKIEAEKFVGPMPQPVSTWTSITNSVSRVFE